MLEVLLIPICFVVAGAVGLRLGTPGRVSWGLVALGAAHVAAFLLAHLALATEGTTADVVHAASQLLFLLGFAALVWLAGCYPTSVISARLMAVAIALAVAGPLVAALSAPTPVVVDASVSLGPVVSLLPAAFAGVSGAPLMLLPLLALITFAVRFWRAEQAQRRMMRWPIVGFGVVALLVVTGTLLGARHEGVVTVVFLLGAPVVPLSLALGPVARRLDDLGAQLAEAHGARRVTTAPELAVLSPRELQVLEAMAQGHANPVIARRMHLSLSSVEKHATSAFRKLTIPEGPEVHRRVAAVVAYRDAMELAGGSSVDQPT